MVAHLLQVFIGQQRESELRTTSHNTSWTTLEQGLEALLLV
jgi:hypothetical protein